MLAKCDALDGVKDGLIGDPTKCHFDPASLLCKGEELDGCLTSRASGNGEDCLRRCEDQKGRDHLDRIRARRRAAIRGPEEVLPRSPAEAGTASGIPGYEDADYDFHKFDLESDVALADKSGIDAHTADLAHLQAPMAASCCCITAGRIRPSRRETR